MVSSKHKSQSFGADIVGKPPPARTTRVREPAGEDVRATLWGMALTLIGFKIVTSVLILWYFPSWNALFIVIALSSLWFLPLAYLVPRHVSIRQRIWRMRLKRRELMHQEWNID